MDPLIQRQKVLRHNKATLRFFLIGIAILISQNLFSQQLELIPLPNQYKPLTGNFILNSNTAVVNSDKSTQSIANFLQKELLRHTGIATSLQTEHAAPSVTLKLSSKKETNINSYSLEIKPAGINISSSSKEGLFNGVISFLQLARKSELKSGNITLKCWDIEDASRYQWRGFMLDESRHFFGKEKVKNILDWMAYYKLNRFHWHLTDQAGWRLEIKQYPRLGTVGGIGNHTDNSAPSLYYTQDDINEIVSYAEERFISIIPEFDMPGHATAANMAYPEFSGGGSESHPEFTFNPAKDEAYSYLTNIIKEADALFPSQMIHLGGDEVSFGNEKWNTDPSVRKLMIDHKLKDLKAVEEYFVSRISDTILKLNNKIIGWDEIVESKLPRDKTIIMWWRHDKPQQLKIALDRGFSVVLCPRLPLYYDFVQDSTHKFGRKWQGGFNSLDKVYEFSHDRIAEAANKEKQILGIQANLWTETVGTEDRLDYLLFPRISALAEAAWTETSKKNFTEFNSRLKGDLELFRKAGIYYFDPNSTNHHSEPAAPDKQ